VDSHSDTRAGGTGQGADSEFLLQIIALARTLLAGASSCTNRDHAEYCRRAAQDFYLTASRLANGISVADDDRSEIHAALTEVASRLSAPS
jgi:hypothetical protein